jgi:hypothetical protein
MNNTFDGLISRLDTAKERLSQFEDRTIETSETQMKETRTLKSRMEF